LPLDPPSENNPEEVNVLQDAATGPTFAIATSGQAGTIAHQTEWWDDHDATTQ
jgi:hypothetical protein